MKTTQAQRDAAKAIYAMEDRVFGPSEPMLYNQFVMDLIDDLEGLLKMLEDYHHVETDKPQSGAL